MTKLVQSVFNLIGDEDGAALIEYTVLLGMLLVAVIVTITSVGHWVSTEWTALHSQLH